MDFTEATATNAQGVSGPIADSPLWNGLGLWRVAPHSAAVAKVTPLANADGTSTFADTWKRRK